MVVLVGARDSGRGERAAAILRSENIDARFVLLDVTKEATIHAAVDYVERQFRRLDVLINNAGVLLPNAPSVGQGSAVRPPSDCTIDSLRQTFETNFFGAFMVTKAFLPLLRRSEAGRIVNVSSLHASLQNKAEYGRENGHTLYLAYCASKTALNALTAICANELRETPIKVNSICPGYVDTDLSSHMGTKSPAEAARIPVHYATLPADGPTGGFFDDAGPIPW
jgi:NAD(P)-dependent dehydrogenase (short-subunit alcohol dehydrogenase family)